MGKGMRAGKRKTKMGGGDTAALKQETEALKNKSSEVFS